METSYPKRKHLRLNKFDYNSTGAYFLTLCTENRQPILSRIFRENETDNVTQIELLPYGLIAEKHILETKNINNDMLIESYVIMPDHIHFLISVFHPKEIILQKTNAIIPRFVSTFKRFCNKEIGYSIWQRGYYDHIIKNNDDYQEHIRYIMENPHKRLMKQILKEEIKP